MKAIHILIKGNVHGVFFRVSAKIVADDLGIHGRVENTEDGSVEIHAEGSDEALKNFIEWCHIGPEMADVHDVTVTEAQQENCTEFTIIR